jgi:hypothetical protein
VLTKTASASDTLELQARDNSLPTWPGYAVEALALAAVSRLFCHCNAVIMGSQRIACTILHCIRPVLQSISTPCY